MQRRFVPLLLLVLWTSVAADPAPVPTATTQRAWRRDASPEMGLAGHRANQSSRRDAGSAATLTGTTLLYHVWVNDRESSWSEARRKEVKTRMDAALGFLTREGLKYQQRPKFIEQFAPPVSLDEAISAKPEVASGFTDRAVKAASGLSPAELVARLRKDAAVQNVLILLHVNKSGRSYNVSFYQGVPEGFAAERLVLFTQFNARQQTPPATYAHEILHGFGAGDLYFPFDKDSDRFVRAKRLFPNDAMLRIDENIARLEIDEWTAYRIGWLKTLKPDLQFLEDAK